MGTFIFRIPDVSAHSSGTENDHEGSIVFGGVFGSYEVNVARR